MNTYPLDSCTWELNPSPSNRHTGWRRWRGRQFRTEQYLCRPADPREPHPRQV